MKQNPPGSRGYKKFMLNSAEHEIAHTINVKMTTDIGILTFISRQNSLLGLSEPAHNTFLKFLYLLAFKSSC